MNSLQVLERLAEIPNVIQKIERLPYLESRVKELERYGGRNPHEKLGMKQACEFLKDSRYTLVKYVQNGHLKNWGINSHYKFKLKDLCDLKDKIMEGVLDGR